MHFRLSAILSSAFAFFLSLLSSSLHASPLQQVQPWLGIEVDANVTTGVKAKRVIHSTPAERAGLKDGDLITSIDAEKVKTREELMAVLRAKGVGTTVTVHFKRKDKAEKLQLKLEILPDMLDLAKAQLIDKQAPDFTLKMVGDGKTIKRSDLLGKVYILEFWATWCPACRAAAPFINKWADANKSIQVFGVSDEEPDLLAAYAKKEKLTYPFATDPSKKIQGSFAMGSIPAFILIDKKGFVKDISVGVGEYLEKFLNRAHELDKQKS